MDQYSNTTLPLLPPIKRPKASCASSNGKTVSDGSGDRNTALDKFDRDPVIVQCEIPPAYEVQLEPFCSLQVLDALINGVEDLLDLIHFEAREGDPHILLPH